MLGDPKGRGQGRRRPLHLPLWGKRCQAKGSGGVNLLTLLTLPFLPCKGGGVKGEGVCHLDITFPSYPERKTFFPSPYFLPFLTPTPIPKRSGVNFLYPERADLTPTLLTLPLRPSYPYPFALLTLTPFYSF